MIARLRNSNIELLRIVCMFFIVLEHILIMGTDFFTAPVGYQGVAANMIIGFTYVGVDCFILITGYFGSDLSWKRCLHFYLICALYEVLGFVVAYSLGKVDFSLQALSYIIFPISHSNTWFVRCYAILLLLIPLINYGLNSINKRQYQYVLCCLLILNLYFGWFQKQPNFSGDGYSASQMVFLYVVGGYLNRHLVWNQLRHKRQIFLIVYVVCALLWGIITIQNGRHVVPHWNGWAYNNPIVLTAAIALFCYFNCLELNSSYINCFASGMFAVFLIHMNRYLSGPIYDFAHYCIYETSFATSLACQIACLMMLAISVVIIGFIINEPFRLIYQRILRKISPVINNHISKEDIVGGGK